MEAAQRCSVAESFSWVAATVRSWQAAATGHQVERWENPASTKAQCRSSQAAAGGGGVVLTRVLKRRLMTADPPVLEMSIIFVSYSVICEFVADQLVKWKNKMLLFLQERRVRDSRAVGQASQGLVSEPLEPLVQRHALRHLHRAPHGPRRWEGGLSLPGVISLKANLQSASWILEAPSDRRHFQFRFPFSQIP